MAEIKYQSVPHDHDAFLKKARKHRGFQAAYQALAVEYAVANEMLAARTRAGLTQEAVAVGLSKRLIDEGVRYASERRQFGQPIAQFQMIQAMLADSEAESFAARAMVEKTARDKDGGIRITKESACCKYFATEALWRIADRVLQIHGGYGYIKEYPIERLFRDARLLRIYEGTSQIQQLIIAKEMLRERAA